MITPPRPVRLSWRAATQRAVLLLLGTVLAAFGYAVFQFPHHLAAGGIGGLSLIVNHFTGWPVGLSYGLMNIPLLIIGYRDLGRWPFVLQTLAAAAMFSLFTDLFIAYLPFDSLSDDLVLNTIYGGIVGGIGGGLVYRAGSTMGGTGILGRMIQKRTGQPLSQVYFYTDGGILMLLGIVFGWPVALYGLLMLFLNGMASDYILEGPSSTRVAMIVTTRPEPMAARLMEALHRGITCWEVTGGYTGQERTMLMCTISRAQVGEIRGLVAQIDADAFVTIGVTHQVLGQGFTPLPHDQQ